MPIDSSNTNISQTPGFGSLGQVQSGTTTTPPSTTKKMPDTSEMAEHFISQEGSLSSIIKHDIKPALEQFGKGLANFAGKAANAMLGTLAGGAGALLLPLTAGIGAGVGYIKETINPTLKLTKHGEQFIEPGSQLKGAKTGAKIASTAPFVFAASCFKKAGIIKTPLEKKEAEVNSLTNQIESYGFTVNKKDGSLKMPPKASEAIVEKVTTLQRNLKTAMTALNDLKKT